METDLDQIVRICRDQADHPIRRTVVELDLSALFEDHATRKDGLDSSLERNHESALAGLQTAINNGWSKAWSEAG